MAEYVQQKVEEMTNEVLQLERVGLFDKSEIKKIMNHRKKHEYKLRRRVNTKENYMDYIQYEINTLSLINVRRKQNGYKHKKEEIEGAIYKRITSMFSLMCRNWPQAQDIWLARIKFVHTTMKNKSIASALYTRMLQVITNVPNLWLLAAKYEFECVYSMESARHVLTKGLAFNKESKLLWHEYFRLECLFLENVYRRAELKKVKGLSKVDIPKYVDDDMLRDEVKEGKVACAVYTHARQAIPDDYSFAAGFIDVIKVFEFESSPTIEDHIFTELFETFGDRPALWEVKANRYIDTVEQESKEFPSQLVNAEERCTKLLRRMLKKADSEDSWSVYLSVNWRLMNLQKSEDSVSKFLLLLALVDSKGYMSEPWTHRWIELAASQGDVSETTLLLEKAIHEFPQSESMWCLYIEYSALTETNITKAVSIFHRARKTLKKESVKIWQMILTLCTGQLNSQQLTDLYEVAIVSHASVAAPMKERYLHWKYQTQGIKQTRILYKRLRQLISGSEGLHKLYIQMETSELKVDLNRIRKAYRHMLEEYGDQSVDAWLEIIDLEKSAGDVSQTSVLYSQAIKRLDGGLVEEFINRQAIRAVQKPSK